MTRWTNQQIDAIEKSGTNIIVSAGAGSGKTAVLTERVCQYILAGNDLSSLLILTFTNTAAREMKQRIRKKIRSSSLSDERKMSQLNMVDSSYIMTFDAFALNLVQKYHYLLNVRKSISIIPENILRMKQDECLDEILERLFESKDPQFENLVRKYCNRDDENIREYVLKLNRQLNLRYDKREYLENYVSLNYTPEHAQQLFDQLHLTVRKIIDRMFSFSVALGDFVKDSDKCRQSYQSLVDYVRGLKDEPDYDSLRERLSDDLPSRFTEKEGTPIRKQIVNLNEKLQNELLFSKQEYIDNYLSEADDCQVLISMIIAMEDMMDQYKKAKDLYEFKDVFHMALQLVMDYPQIKQDLKNSFNQIMVDEYQDTNDLQEKFISLIADDNTYMVGDIKQSIYRFNNANPVIFKEKYDAYKANRGGIAIDLLDNFRSRPEVLNNINFIFERLMDDQIGGTDYQGQRMVYGNTKYDGAIQQGIDYNMEIMEYDDDRQCVPFDRNPKPSHAEIEAYLISRDIRQKIRDGYKVMDDEGNLRPAQYSDFCILIDRATEFDIFKRVMTMFNIPAVIYQDERMKDSDLLEVIRSIFKLISMAEQKEYDDSFKMCFVSLARSFLVRYSDEKIFDIVKNRDYRNTSIMEKIETIAADMSCKSIVSLLDEVMEQFDVYDRLDQIGEIVNNNVKIDSLYQLAESFSSLGNDCSDFIGMLDYIFDDDRQDVSFSVNRSQENAVKIMTIHKSKGLQFPVVYLPSLKKKFNRSDIRSERVLYSSTYGIILPDCSEEGMLSESMTKKLYRDEYLKEDVSEKIRLLYVALTRSQEKIIMVYPASDKTALGNRLVVDDEIRMEYGSFADMIDSIYGRLAHFVNHVEITAEEYDQYLQLDQRRLFDAISKTQRQAEVLSYPCQPAKPVSSSGFSKDAGLISPQTRDKMEFGTKMHYYLQMLDFNQPDLSIVPAKYRQRLQKFIDSELMKDRKKGEALKEYEFTYNQQGMQKHGFIDLLMKYDDHLDIIDYKLKNIDDDNYRLQLNGYRDYIRKLTDKPVNCYLYSVIDGSWQKVEETA